MIRALLLLLPFLAFPQSSDFFKPADSLDRERRTAVVMGTAALAGGSLVALNQLWYADYSRSPFHFVNDNSHWLQVDKAGHVFGTYHLGKITHDILRWSGVSENQSLIYGSATGLAFMTAVEYMDGRSARWGASWGDMAANVGGTALFVGQQLLWNEQRIVPKFSFHTTPYAGARPEVLGETKSEQLFKDYNGQTYWLSANVKSFWNGAPVPGWLNLAVGYGAEGMITGEDDFVNMIFLPEQERFRQFYLSVDVDLTRIQTDSHLLKTIFSVLNTVKIPAPTLEFTSRGIVKGHLLYF